MRQGDTSLQAGGRPGGSLSQETGGSPTDSAVSPWESPLFPTVSIQLASFPFLFIHVPFLGSLATPASASAKCGGGHGETNSTIPALLGLPALKIRSSHY